MSLTSDESSPKTPEPRSEGWLESWKEIAAYLRRSVRSARRWEKEEGLPVHRHPHSKGDSVYAYKSELDAWWKNRGAAAKYLEDEESAAESPVPEEPAIASAPANIQDSGLPKNLDLPRKPRTAFLLGVGLSVAIIVAVAWVSRHETSPKRPALPFEARECVLVSAFENRSGQAQLDGTVEYALERELSNSRYVNVVPRERIGDALRLMRKPRDTRVDAAIGREVCLRDGEIRALITGRIERIGRRYLLTAELVDPNHGTAVASVAEDASDDEGLLPAARRISDQVRTMLGENLTSTPADGDLQKVTTPSFDALRLYSHADALIKTGGYKAAEELLRQAIVEDPDFASAHLLLAYAIFNQEKPKAEYLPEAEVAFRLSDRTTERERYFIRGSYYGFLGQRDKQIAAYEALLSVYPDHFWAMNNLSIQYENRGQQNDAARMATRLADLRPKDFGANTQAAWGLARLDPDPDPVRTRKYAYRALALVSPEVAESDPFNFAWVELFDARERWLQRDVAGALVLATRFAETLDSASFPKKDEALSQLGNFYVMLGKLKEAEALFHREADPIGDLASLSLIQGNREDLKRFSSEIIPTFDDARLSTVILLSRSGLVDQAARVLAQTGTLEEASYNRGMLEAARGELAMARGDTAEATRQLVKCRDLGPSLGRHEPLLAMETLASELSRRGDLDDAIGTLELGSRHEAKLVSVYNGAYWERNQLLLTRLYLKTGRVADAQRIESTLTKLVAIADPDYATLVELNRLRASSTQVSFAPAHLIR